MVRIEPDFEAVTVNALLAGFEFVFSAVSKVTLSLVPSTFALFTRDGSTVTVTVSSLVVVPSLTVSEKVRSVWVLTDGAMNAGVDELASSSITVGPAVCDHA